VEDQGELRWGHTTESMANPMNVKKVHKKGKEEYLSTGTGGFSWVELREKCVAGGIRIPRKRGDGTRWIAVGEGSRKAEKK